MSATPLFHRPSLWSPFRASLFVTSSRHSPPLRQHRLRLCLSFHMHPSSEVLLFPSLKGEVSAKPTEGVHPSSEVLQPCRPIVLPSQNHSMQKHRLFKDGVHIILFMTSPVGCYSFCKKSNQKNIRFLFPEKALAKASAFFSEINPCRDL